jgi:Integrase core domain.
VTVLRVAASGCDQAHAQHKPRLLSDNGSSYISGDLAEWLDDRRMKHVRGAPYYPQTQGKIERWHQTLKNWKSSVPWPVLLYEVCGNRGASGGSKRYARTSIGVMTCQAGLGGYFNYNL